VGAPKAPKPRQAVRILRQLLEEVQKAYYHEPDSDAMQFCVGCGQSPYWLPQHKMPCLVVRIEDVLKVTKDSC
jgi:hypothetical protein